MSGAELALAIVPLVIVLVEHHRTVLRKSKALTLSRISNDQQLDFYQDLHGELTLLNMILERVKIKSARVRLSGSQPEMTQAESIEIALGNSADDFQSILDRVLRSINDLVREKSNALTQDDIETQRNMLQRLRHLEGRVENGKASKSTREKFRFTRNEKTRSVAMKRIQDGVLKLERLLGSSTEIFDHQRRAARRKTPANRIRRLPEEVFRKLASKWPCPCNARHLAKLCLWNCCYARDNSSGSDDSLGLILSVPVDERSLHHWKETTFRVTESQEDQISENNDGEHHVRFAGGQAPPTSRPAPPGRNIESESLCNLLQRAQDPNISLQILFENGILWQQKAKRSRLQIRHQLDASLRSLLETDQRWKHCDLRDKSILAVTLAHAVMHRSEGPWLHADLNKDEIFFFRKNNGQHPDVSRPFLAMDFTKLETEPDEEDDLFSIHSNPTLLSLGVLLLEITNGTLIENHWDTEDLTDGSTQNDSTNLTAALRLLRKSDGKVVIGLQKAVKACLEWDSMNDGRDDIDFPKRVYELIVEPLEDVLWHGFNIRPEQLGFD
ncbi:unnamed protein product [Alternaria alternata]|uniref:DUF7580 domain-containing protein n=1 Tax=Alternaria tenuissima TaxID=119927 RepID=A0AB37W714_9PLEO|nr:hypothetical protein AA0115_g9424 [Alternaria tenuissima]RYN85415.1 hypothetical protein AA0120_g8631 [Alternaria tenuissima]